MIGSLAYWGCGRNGNLDIFNCARVHSYLDLYSSNPKKRSCCPDIGPFLQPDDAALGLEMDGPFVSPEADKAWWYRTGRPESAGFFGLEVTSLSGMYTNTTQRAFTTSASSCNDLTYGPAKSDGVELVVEGILHGATCCAVAYGLRALTQQLKGCCGQCTGNRLRLLTCLPVDTPHGCGVDYQLPAETTSPWRTLHNVVMTEYPSIVGQNGPSCGCGCSKMTYVRFVLRANPNVFLDPVTLLATTPLPQGEECIVICDPDCVDIDPFLDPNCTPPILPEPTVSPKLCYCPPVAANRQCFTTTLPATLFDSRLAIKVYAGEKPLRNLRIRMWRQVGTLDFTSGIYNNCNTCIDIGIAYVPEYGTWILSPCDGVNIAAMGQVRPARQSLYSGQGQPRPPCVTLPCGDFVICLEADIFNTSTTATVELSRIEMEPA